MFPTSLRLRMKRPGKPEFDFPDGVEIVEGDAPAGKFHARNVFAGLDGEDSVVELRYLGIERLDGEFGEWDDIEPFAALTEPMERYFTLPAVMGPHVGFDRALELPTINDELAAQCLKVERRPTPSRISGKRLRSATVVE